MGTPNLEQNPIVSKLRAWDPQAVTEAREFRGELTIVVPRGLLRRAAELLSRDAEWQFSFLSDITAVDRFPLEPRFELNYHVVSLSRRERLRLKVRVAGGDAAVESVTTVWPTADWHEREIFDLFGVRFEGHPDLRRIFMPEDWEGHPLRKDYPVEGYR
ncbi:MAG TPA: NADH-quinone oxidoreductase subunit C [Candidatus Acidoferrales bacterium]|nr:NADH-quinone oxidoreductase subunit C [Candidatus Acidoferrales bacterium]